MIDLIDYLTKNSKCIIKKDVDMSEITSFKTGGVASLIIEPSSIEDIKYIVRYCKYKGFNVIVLGSCNNVLISDNKVDCVIIKFGNNYSEITLDDDNLVIEAGCSISHFLSTSLNLSLGGGEFLAGIPGTIGGAVFMNAGAFQGEISDIVSQVEYIDSEGNLRKVSQSDMCFKHRFCMLHNHFGIICRVKLNLHTASNDLIRSKINTILNQRKIKFPIRLPNAGCIFKRPEGYFAGKLIDEQHLKGVSIGGACVSQYHAGFIVNTGSASSNDIYKLITFVRERVKDATGIKLEEEIRYIGEF